MNRIVAAIESLNNVAELGLRQALVVGLWAGLILMIVAVLQLGLGRWLSRGQCAVLWGIVLLRLLIPWAPGSPLSLQNLVTLDETPAAVGRDAEGALVAQVVRDGVAAYGAPEPAMIATPASPAQAGGVVADVFEALLESLPLVWLSAAVASLVWTLTIHARLCLRVRQTAPSLDAALKGLWDACCEQAGVRERIPIVVYDGIHQPAVLGWLRPTLLLPSDVLALDAERLRMIMLHELAHVRRWDVAANWLLIVVRAVQGWNPVYWIAAARYRSLREQACDAFVIQKTQVAATRDYSELLLQLAGRQPQTARWRVMLPASLLGFLSAFFQKRAVRERLRALPRAGRVNGKTQRTLAASLLLAVAACGLTDARVAPAASDDPNDWLPLAAHEGESPAAIDSEPLKICPVTYDIAKAIERIARPPQTVEFARRNFELLVENLLRQPPAMVTLAAPSTTPTGADEASPAESTDTSYSLQGTQLTVAATQAVHTEIARNLRAWEANGNCQITLETRFLADDRDLASAIGVAWRYVAAASDEPGAKLSARGDDVQVRFRAVTNDYVPIAVATLDAAQTFALVRATQGSRRAHALQAPKVTLFNGQQVSIADSSQTPFVVGIQDLAGGTQQPKIKVYEEGTKITVRIEQLQAPGKHHLEGHFEMSALGEVLTPPTLVAGQPSRIQIPSYKEWSIDVAADVEDGQSLLVGCVPNCERKNFLYILLTPRSIVEESTIALQ